MRGLSTVAATALATAGIVNAQLNDLSYLHLKKYFGTATDNPELSDKPYAAILDDHNEFGQVTPANSMKWDAIEPEQNVFNFTGGDQIANLAASTGKLLRCHNLVWHNQLPAWVSEGNFDNATLISILRTHIHTEVSHYRGRCYAWDVVNEALNDDGTYRSDVFYNTIGPSYIPMAFKFAAEADPLVRLYYNDYNIETPGAKTNSVLDNIIPSIKAYGARIDGIGMQSHFIVGETPSQASLVAAQQSFLTALGPEGEVAVTELDIRTNVNSTGQATEAELQQQKTDYDTTVSACLQTGIRCVGITVWDFTDKYSWVASTFPGQGAACPWDANLQKKPAYYGIVNALLGRSSRSLRRRAAYAEE